VQEGDRKVKAFVHSFDMWELCGGIGRKDTMQYLFSFVHGHGGAGRKEQGNLEFGWLVGGRYTQYYHLLIIRAGGPAGQIQVGAMSRTD